ncbi:MAG TPA: efflux RND transporter permease subunit [Chthoniobacterales bacterium]|nr:efflux RND transporter permease subunit [Chthoniobacterales bacterium]
MWIIRLALNRPYTFVVAALLLILLTPFVLIKTPTDIFPSINIPVVSIIWSYNGLSAREIEQRIIYTQERALTTTVNNIEHMESTSYDGIGIIKLYFQPGVTISTAVAQVTAVSQTILRQLPAGATPPLIIQYDAATVPVLQYGIGSTTLSEQQTFDVALNQIRVGLVSVPGIAIPFPFGGKQRLVSVDLDARKLQEKNLTQTDVTSAINAQALVFPSGTTKFGAIQYPIDINTFPGKIDLLNELPIKVVDGTQIRVGDVAQVRDGYDPQQNIVRQDGVRSTLMSVFKSGTASTLSVVSGAKQAMANVLKTVTNAVQVKEFADQSLFVRAAVSGVAREGIIAAALTALMILLFLGSWRSTLIIAISIPLAVLSSIAVLSLIGETINLMTLGGLALAVGILVDDATVTIENVERHMSLGEKLEDAILKGAGEIALPAFVSTLCICIVFVPMFLLSGVARYLFVPLAEAVIFAVAASYLLSRTLVPTLIMWFERNHHKAAPKNAGDGGNSEKPEVPLWIRPFKVLQQLFERGFDRFRTAYHNLLGIILTRRVLFAAVFLGLCAGSWILVPFLGQDFFPAVDSGSFQLHVRAVAGTRVEETAKLVDQVEAVIRERVPAQELKGIIDNIGLPTSGINLSYNNSGVAGSADADVMVALQTNHKPTAEYVRQLRLDLHQRFPGAEFYFLPADIVTQTINFGLPAPFDVQILGRDLTQNHKIAGELAQKIRHVTGAVDVRVQQPAHLQRLQFTVDRTKAAGVGLTERDVASSVLLSLSGSGQTAPSYWLDPTTGVQYLVNVRMPEYRLTSLDSLQALPVSASQPGAANGQLLTNLASFTRTNSQPIYTHYNILPVVDVFGGIANRDLGGVLGDIQKIVAETEKNLPRGTSIMVRGQALTMNSSFIGLGIGLVAAIALIYLLLVVNFQSWLDPFIILTALTGALAGVIWGLYVTGTTMSVPAMMGAIMCMGVATANSVLIVTFARQQLDQGLDPLHAAWEAGTTRLRPVLMTAMAMIIGMLPMALGLGEGGEQNAPLGRGVIGGLMVATIATLLFVPVVFSLLHRSSQARGKSKTEEENAAGGPIAALPAT